MQKRNGFILLFRKERKNKPIHLGFTLKKNLNHLAEDVGTANRIVVLQPNLIERFEGIYYQLVKITFFKILIALPSWLLDWLSLGYSC
jgi:hypothetical protein